MNRFTILIFYLLFLVLFSGCQNNNNQIAEIEREAVSVTLWTDNTELFMEHPPLVVGQEAAFAVHLSNMKDFKPVIEGQLTCIFTKQSGKQVTVIAESPSYPGIFRPVVQFREDGEYDMELRLEGFQVSDVIRLPGVQVYANESDIPETHAADSGEELISFLKEQQWKIDFRTKPAQNRILFSSIPAVGEIIPILQNHAEVPAMVNGVILADQNESIPSIGNWVNKEDILAVLSPPADTESSLNSIRSEYLITKAEFERAQRLFDKQAISERRLNEAQLQYEAKKAGYDVLTQQVDSNTNTQEIGASSPHFHLKSPINGVVQSIHFHIGQSVKSGDKLFTITDSRRVFLKANVPVAQIQQLKKANDAIFKIEGYAQEFKVSELDGKFVSIGSIVDEKSRTVPVFFELANPNNVLKIGMFAEIFLAIGEEIETLAIPNSAIFDDDGTSVAYVHIEGESFAKRILETGVSYDGYTQILSGISAGERVTTEGGYQVRLASLSTSVPVGHGHEH